MADNTIKDLLESIDLDSADPNIILASILKTNKQATSSIVDAIKKSINSATESLEKNSNKTSAAFDKFNNKLNELAENMVPQDIFASSPSVKAEMERKYKIMAEKIMKSMSSDTKPQVNQAKKATPNMSLKDKSFFAREGVIIGGFSDDAIDQLKTAFDNLSGQDSKKKRTWFERKRESGSSSADEGGPLKKGLDILRGLTLLGGGIFAASKLMSPEVKEAFGGVYSAIKNLLKVGFERSVKRISREAKQAFKKIKVEVTEGIDTAMEEWDEFKETDLGKDISAIISSGAKLAIPGMLLSKTILSKIGSKVARTKLVAGFTKFTGALVKKGGLAKFGGKFLPGVGTLIYFAYASKALEAGDYDSALLDYAAGVSLFIPGFGPMIATGLTVANTINEIKETPEDKALEAERAKQGLPGFGFYLGKMINDKLIKGINWRKVPGIRTILAFADTYELFKNADDLDGYKAAFISLDNTLASAGVPSMTRKAIRNGFGATVGLIEGVYNAEFMPAIPGTARWKEQGGWKSLLNPIKLITDFKTPAEAKADREKLLNRIGEGVDYTKLLLPDEEIYRNDDDAKVEDTIKNLISREKMYYNIAVPFARGVGGIGSRKVSESKVINDIIKRLRLQTELEKRKLGLEKEGSPEAKKEIEQIEQQLRDLKNVITDISGEKFVKGGFLDKGAISYVVSSAILRRAESGKGISPRDEKLLRTKFGIGVDPAFIDVEAKDMNFTDLDLLAKETDPFKKDILAEKILKQAFAQQMEQQRKFLEEMLEDFKLTFQEYSPTAVNNVSVNSSTTVADGVPPGGPLVISPHFRANWDYVNRR